MLSRVDPSLVLALLFALGAQPAAQFDVVRSEHKLSATSGGPVAGLAAGDSFGWAVAALGDLDGDGVGDLAVGAQQTDGAEVNEGSVRILFLNVDGSVRAQQEIAESTGGFGGALSADDRFGFSVASLGDLDLDGVVDIAVGAPLDDDGDTNEGAVWIVFLNSDGTVKAEQKISETSGGFGGALEANDDFGWAVASLGDLDGDDVPDLAVGAPGAGFNVTGEVWALFLEPDGTVRSEQQIAVGNGSNALFGASLATLGDMDRDGLPELVAGSLGSGGSQGALTLLSLDPDGSAHASSYLPAWYAGLSDEFASAIAAIGDIDMDGVPDLAVGAQAADDAIADRGSVWILFFERDGTLKTRREIRAETSGFEGTLEWLDHFGAALAPLGDFDGDGAIDLAVGAPGDDDGASAAGALWILHLRTPETAGTVKSAKEIPHGVLPNAPWFGWALANAGDVDGDGIEDLAAGAPLDDDGGTQQGAAWILFLDSDGTIRAEQKISELSGGFGGVLDLNDWFGSSVAGIGDLDADGTPDLAVGARLDDDGGNSQGAVWILFLNPDGNVKAHQKISATVGGFSGTPGTVFGASVACVGDLDGNGTQDLAVGAPGNDGARGAVWILFLNADGTVSGQQRIGRAAGGFAGTLDPQDEFGTSLAFVGPALAVGAPRDDDGGGDRGATWLLFLDSAGTVAAEQKISATSGGFVGPLIDNTHFGSSAGALHDLDGDGLTDLVVGTEVGFGPGLDELWVFFLAADGTVRSEQRIARNDGGFRGNLQGHFAFGAGLAALDDLDGDGVRELAVGDPSQSAGILDRLWFLRLDGNAVLDFEHEDDLATPLANGQDVSTPPEFGRLVSISASGANVGAAIFDSDPAGPNAAGADPDLLVDSGKLLILQSDASATQTVPGVFDQPDDDADGGAFTFAFPVPVRLQHVDLVDIDASSSAIVELEDRAGRVRTFTLPPDWTGDLLLGGGPRRLDLLWLAAQPGHASNATASEDVGFSPRNVVRLEIVLGGPGAIDQVVWKPRAVLREKAPPASGRSGASLPTRSRPL